MAILSVELAILHLSNIALRYWRLRARAIKRLSAEDEDIVRKGSSTANLERSLANMKASGRLPASNPP